MSLTTMLRAWRDNWGLNHIPARANKDLELRIRILMEQQLAQQRIEEAKWWAAHWNVGNGLCPPSNNCSECDEARKHYTELQAAAGGEK